MAKESDDQVDFVSGSIISSKVHQKKASADAFKYKPPTELTRVDHEYMFAVDSRSKLV